MTDTMQAETSPTETTQEAPPQVEAQVETPVENTESTNESTADPSLFDETESSSDVSERPEWLPEKFNSPEDLSKSYLSLEKKLGAHTGAPEEYEFKVPELLQDYSINSDDPFAQDFSRILKDNGVNQKTYDEISTLYFNKRKAEDETIQEAHNQQFKEDCQNIGTEGVQEVKESIKWAKTVLPEETYDLLRQAGERDMAIGLMIKQFHDVAKGTNYTKMPDVPSQHETTEERQLKCRKLMKDPRMKTDLSYQKMVNDYYRSVYS